MENQNLVVKQQPIQLNGLDFDFDTPSPEQVRVREELQDLRDNITTLSTDMFDRRMKIVTQQNTQEGNHVRKLATKVQLAKLLNKMNPAK